MTRPNNCCKGDYSKQGTDTFYFFQKYLDKRDMRPQNTCASLDKLCFFSLSKVMQDFCSFESYENIKNNNCSILTYQAKKTILACCRCLYFLNDARPTMCLRSSSISVHT